MRKSAKLFALLIATILIGCSNESERTFAQCKIEATRIFPDEVGSFMRKDDPYMVNCMRAKGYKLEVWPFQCKGSVDFAQQPYCFVPDGFIARTIFDMQTQNEIHDPNWPLPDSCSESERTMIQAKLQAFANAAPANSRFIADTSFTADERATCRAEIQQFAREADVVVIPTPPAVR